MSRVNSARWEGLIDSHIDAAGEPRFAKPRKSRVFRSRDLGPVQLAKMSPSESLESLLADMVSSLNCSVKNRAFPTEFRASRSVTSTILKERSFAYRLNSRVGWKN